MRLLQIDEHTWINPEHVTGVLRSGGCARILLANEKHVTVTKTAPEVVAILTQEDTHV